MHLSRKWVHLQEDSKEPLSKINFLHSFSLIRQFLRVFLCTTIEKQENQSNKKSKPLPIVQRFIVIWPPKNSKNRYH